MMVKVLLYGYCIGVASSRRIAQRLHEDTAFRVLAANNTPDFRTISDFRKDHLGALAGLFLQVLAFCQRAGLVKLGHVALDGTKVRANASRHKAMSYKRMKEKEAQLAAEVAELLRRARQQLLGGIVADADRLLELARQAQAGLPTDSGERVAVVGAAELLGQLLLQDVKRGPDGVGDGNDADDEVTIRDGVSRTGYYPYMIRRCATATRAVDGGLTGTRRPWWWTPIAS